LRLKLKMGRRGKRKISNSPSPAIVKKIVKKNVQTNVKITRSSVANLQSSSPPKQSTTPPTQSVTTSHQSTPDADNYGKKIKPIFVNVNILVIKNIIKSQSFSIRPLCKMRGSSSTQVSCMYLNDKKMLITKLQQQQIGFHTFTDTVDKPVYFLLKFYDPISCEDMLSILTDSGVNAKKVTDFIRKPDFVILTDLLQ